MYDNVGVPTARGTGTNGFVQKNLSYIRSARSHTYDYTKQRKPDPHVSRKPNPSIIDHEKKRQIEVKCMELMDLLERSNRYTQDEIEDQVSQLRNTLLEARISHEIIVKGTENDSHVTAKLHSQKMETLRDAFGIDEFAEEGAAFRKMGIGRSGERVDAIN